MAATRRPDPPPFRTNEFAPVIVGTCLWAVAFLVLLTQHHAMAARGQGWWLWVTLTGFGLGLWGLTMLQLRHRGLRKTAARSAAQTAQGTEADQPAAQSTKPPERADS
jgi:hypothetical protein